MFITFGEVLQIGINRLKEARISDAKRDAEELMLYLMHEERKFLFLHYRDDTDEDHADAFFEMVDRKSRRRAASVYRGQPGIHGTILLR